MSRILFYFFRKHAAHPPTSFVANSTADLIRDRAITVISNLTPTYLAGQKFRPSSNRHSANFIKQCEKQPNSAFRLFQVRDTGDDRSPPVTNTDFAERFVTLAVTVAYPQDYAANLAPQGKQALDRDRLVAYDQHLILYSIGFIGGRANFSSIANPSYPDAVPLAEGEIVKRQVGAACDYLTIQVRYKFTRLEP